MSVVKVRLLNKLNKQTNKFLTDVNNDLPITNDPINVNILDFKVEMLQINLSKFNL